MDCKNRFARTVLLGISSICLVAALEAAPRVASIATFSGKVMVRRAETKEIEAIQRRRTPLFQGDEVRTATDASATILFADGSRVDVGPRSGIKLNVSGRNREIKVTQGSLKSDIKKLPGMKTSFRTPSGVAAVKGTLVDCVVKEDNKIEIAADLGLLTHEIGETTTSVDLDKGRRLEIGFQKESGTVMSKSLIGDIDVKTKNLTTELKEKVEVETKVDNSSDKVTLGVIDGSAKTSTERGTQFLMDKGDEVDFVESATGTTATVGQGQVTIIDVTGSRSKLKRGETTVELPGYWLEPETPEGPEVMIPPGT